MMGLNGSRLWRMPKFRGLSLSGPLRGGLKNRRCLVRSLCGHAVSGVAQRRPEQKGR